MFDRKVVIFGAGRFGRAANAFYQGRCNIVAYVDNNSKAWGKEIQGIPICSPDILKDNDYSIVIAVQHHVDEIKQQLYQQYKIKDVAVFCISETIEPTYSILLSEPLDELIIKFQGGLGNQMFQYVVYKMFGVKKAEDIDDKLFEAAHPILGDPKKKKWYSVGYNVLKVLRNTNMGLISRI